MSVKGGKRQLGLFSNSDFEKGTNENFTFGELYSGDSYRGRYSLKVTGNGTTLQSTEFIPVDTTKTYKWSVWIKTISTNVNGKLGSGHIGFVCYDKNKVFIDLRNNGGRGDTYLSRDLNAGDAYCYFSSSTDWYTGADVTNNLYYFRHVLFFPPSHPDYSTAHYWTRIGYGSYNIYYKSMTQTAQGDWEVKFADAAGNDATFPDIGYSTPTGTPVSRGVAGGTYNYIFYPIPGYPETWTRYQRTFTGESLNSGTPFRFATKYIKWMNLRNYAYSNEGAPYAEYLLDDILFYEVV